MSKYIDEFLVAVNIFNLADDGAAVVDENNSVLAKQCEKFNSSKIIIHTSDK